jgi:glycine betaine/choline ABC-type transport system substrate-binding protein
VLVKFPALSRALDELTGVISDDEMRRLNTLADVQHRDIADIARDWLAKRVP